jgi:hypothetical protein
LFIFKTLPDTITTQDFTAMNRSLLFLFGVIVVAIIPLVNSGTPAKVDVPGGFEFVNTDGNIRPKGAQIEPGMAGPVRYYRKTNGGEVRVGFFGGLIEAIVVENFELNATYENIYNNRMKEYDPSLRGYREIKPNSEVRPSPRSYSCGGYDVRTNRFYVYGGTNAPARGEELTPDNLFSDLWAFDFTTRLWTQLNYTGDSPADRASTGCATNGSSIFLYSGASFTALFTVGDFNPNDLYRLDLPATTAGTPNWVQLRAHGNTDLPDGRTQPSADRLPGTNKVIMRGGDRFILPDFTRVTQDDIFTYNWITDTVAILDSTNSPKPLLTQDAMAAVSPRKVIIGNGDQQGDLLLNDTCSNPNFVCTFPQSQVNKTFTYNIHTQNYKELIFDFHHEIPATRRSNMGAYVELEDGETELITTYWEHPDDFENERIVVVFNGGYGFNGDDDGLGEIRNTATFLWRIHNGFI